MPRGRQLIRQWRVLRALEGSRIGKTVVELHLDVGDLGSLRTVYRDLEVLEAAGFPLYQDDESRWRLLAPSEGGPAVPVQPSEMIAVLLSEGLLEPLKGTELAEPLARLRSKIEAMLGPKAQAYVDQLRGGLLATVSAPGDYGAHRDELVLLEQAIRENRRVRIEHLSAHRHETLEREIEPYGLWYVDGAVYLIAYDRLRSDYRKYLVDRIRRVELGDRRFEPDPDFDLQAYVGKGFRVWHGAVHRVVVEFAEEVAHLPRERRYHRTQRVEGLEDGRCRVTFEAAGLPDLAAWVASFGGLVRVVEPGELREMVLGLHLRGAQACEVMSQDDNSERNVGLPE